MEQVSKWKQDGTLMEHLLDYCP